MPAALNLVGQTFGRLTVTKKTDQRVYGNRVVWRCVCSCTKEVFAHTDALRSGNTRSCGCLHKEYVESGQSALKHGAARIKSQGKVQPVYALWSGIKKRCFNPNYDHYDRYGGRGITMLRAWVTSFENFRGYILKLPNCPADIENASARFLERSLDRIDNDKDYVPGNLKWSTQKEQTNNNSRTTYITVKGRRMPFTVAVEKYGKASTACIRRRISSGWSVRDAFLTPSRRA